MKKINFILLLIVSVMFSCCESEYTEHIDLRGKYGYTEPEPTDVQKTAYFTYVTSGLTVRFTNRSSSGLMPFGWNFGDDEIALDEETPTHTYAKGGTYKVRLACIDQDTRQTYTYEKKITVSK